MSIGEKALEALRGGPQGIEGGLRTTSHHDGNEVKPFSKEVLTSKKGGMPVKIYSKLFEEEIWLVATKEEMEALASTGVREVVYMAWEIPLLKEINKEKLMVIHSVKKIFPGAGLA